VLLPSHLSLLLVNALQIFLVNFLSGEHKSGNWQHQLDASASRVYRTYVQVLEIVWTHRRRGRR
jgi:hypothetical protein